ncbi:MAG: SH3 domain-containing protein [Spirochaetota bacterium]
MRLYILLACLCTALSVSSCKQEETSAPESSPEEQTILEQDAPANKSTKEDAPQVSNAPARPLTIGMHKVIAENGLMLRTAIDKGSPAIVRMNKNVQAEILEYTNKEEVIEGVKARWAKVKYKKYTGYAFSSYLKPMAGAKTIDPKSETSK